MIPLNKPLNKNKFIVVETNPKSFLDHARIGIEEKGFNGALHFYRSRSKKWKLVPEGEELNPDLYTIKSVLVFFEGPVPIIGSIEKFLENNVTIP